MDSTWNRTFRGRISKFKGESPSSPNDIPLSIKLRVMTGCFHREHAPYAYSIINGCLANLKPEEINFRFVEHESGPGILIYVAATTAAAALAKSIIELIATIIKAHSEGIKRGDRCPPAELIVRRIQEDDQVIEEIIMRIDHRQVVDAKKIEEEINAAISKLLRKRK